MANAIVRGKLNTIWVQFNGDLNDETQRKKATKKLNRKKARLTKSRNRLKAILNDSDKRKEKIQPLQEIDELEEEILPTLNCARFRRHFIDCGEVLHSFSQ